MIHVARTQLEASAAMFVSDAITDLETYDISTSITSQALPDHYVRRLERDEALAEWFMASWVTTVVACVARMGEPRFSPRCVAEEVMFWDIVGYAIDALGEEPGELARWAGVALRDWRDNTLQDTDFLMLFDPGMDGIENDEETAGAMGLENLRLEDWFKPFRSRKWEPIHYATRELWQPLPANGEST